MAQEGYRPSFSLAGAVDLESLKHKAEASMGQEGGAPAAGGYVIDVNENNFESMINSSSTFPILLLVWLQDDQRFFDIARSLADMVSSLDGQMQLARIDGNANPQIVQALRVQGVPALYGLVAGRPIPLMQGMPTPTELQQLQETLLPQIIAMAQQSGVTGTAPFIGEADTDDVSSDNSAAATEEVIPAGHESAHALALAGQYAQAAQEYAALVEHDPHDTIAARERAKCLLLARNGNSDVRIVRAAAADNPDDLQAQLDVADIDMIGGQISDAFGRLLDFIPTHRDDLPAVRERLVEYFAIPDAADPRVKAARQRLMTVMY
ncbi:tetratricopeptide repeat protein [Alloscardovia theropitheci]|uniref:Tetratricopeptide repeat protein n=1 Tax=Alloscardovia theropitheci TaxID=2496842 RepID=A0A4R0QXG7_9BIFI|nr:tetratricopeptide repeat protein [Alloscardovia theropitheci]TCD54131.1 tetratricopeptide repeat protein [Alloscardovia theropitheci]